jgi:2-keto-3-deoxy-6-phosphogluconate aldolase
LVALTCDSWHIAHIPGALTPREIHMAYKVSRGPVKFFPAQQHLDDLKEIRPALARMCPDMTIIASGIRAISEEGLRLVFHSGADVITLGSAFFRKEYIGNWKELGRHIQRLTDMVQRART